MIAWQVPISSMGHGPGGRLAHLFEVSCYTDRLVRAACGESFNPGYAFAAEFSNVRRCEKCEQKQWEIS